MTDKQLRDRIVGALSVSMMPMELEAECVAFLDRCMKQPKTVADKIRAKSDEELADELVRILIAGFEVIYEERPPQETIDECQRLMLEQLRQPADSADDDDKQHSGLIEED